MATIFQDFIKSMQQIYPSAKKIDNYGYTFFIDETTFMLIVYKGRSAKPVINRHFTSLDELNKYYRSFVKKVMDASKINSDRQKRQEEKNEREIKEGAIFYTSWGYEQTNINFYQIIKVKGSKVVLREINQNKEYNDQDRGLTSGIKDAFISDEFSLRVGRYGLKFQNRFLSKWDGKPVRWSSYA